VADYDGGGTAAAAVDDDDDDNYSLSRAVGIVVALWFGGPGDVGSMPDMCIYLSFLHTAQTACGSRTDSCPTDTVVIRPKHEPDL
jgi:hypothetical protein